MKLQKTNQHIMIHSAILCNYGCLKCNSNFRVKTENCTSILGPMEVLKIARTDQHMTNGQVIMHVMA